MDNYFSAIMDDLINKCTDGIAKEGIKIITLNDSKILVLKCPFKVTITDSIPYNLSSRW